MPLLQCEVDLVGKFADTGEDDLASRLAAGTATRAAVRRRRRYRSLRRAKPADEESRGSNWPSRSSRWCVRIQQRRRRTAGIAGGSCWRNRRRAVCRSVRRVCAVARSSARSSRTSGLFMRPHVPAVGEGGWAFLRARVAHFWAGVPFTLSTTMVWSSKASTPLAWSLTALKMA